MANVNDASKLSEKHARRLEQLEEADIDDRDRTAIRAFHDYRRANGSKTTTLTADLSTLRCASERADVQLMDMGETDVEDLLTLLATPKDEGGYGLEPEGSGIFGYCRALRVFFRWLDGRDDYGDYPFHDDIELPKQTFRAPSEDELLTEEEYRALKDAAGRGRMMGRDRALIAFLGDMPRVTFTAQLRVGDVEGVYEKLEPTYRANPEGLGQKGLGDDDDPVNERPFLWSAHEVRRWLSHGHPDRENPKAPLWTKQSYDPENPEDGALGTDGIRSMLARNAERAGIPDGKATNPHAFRHIAITRARRSGVDPKELQKIAGWSDLRPLEAYDHVTDDERNANVRGALGLKTPEEEEDALPPFIDCWNCGEDVERGERFCSACGSAQPLDLRRAQASADALNDDATEEAIDAGRAGDTEAVEAHNAVRETTADVEALASRVAELEAMLEAD